MNEFYIRDNFNPKIFPQILYEDNHIIVAVKPPNVPSQADSSKDADFLSAVKEYVKIKYSKPGETFLGLVHRLDRPCGGVMVFARTSKAAARLNDAIKSYGFDKRYLAIVKETPNLKKDDVLKNYIIKDRQRNTSRVTNMEEKGAKYAELNYKTVEVKEERALVEIQLKTGRPHQIRVQMAHIGAPLEGDYRYGGSKGVNLALWAYALKFTHPVKKEVMQFCVPPPNYSPWNYFNSSIDKILSQTAKNQL